MKRVFIFISTILFSCYLVTMIVQQNQQISFSSYNAVDVTGQALTDHKVSNRKEVTDALTNLANEHNSLIARRIVQPNEKGEIDFRYQFYGHVSPPSNLKRASQESAEGSDIVSNYLIVSGDLKGAELISTFSQLGYNAVDFSSYSILSLLLTILLNEVSLISFALFLLTFASLVLIYRIKDLRDAGIKLVSGQSMMKVMLSSFIVDARQLLIAYCLSILIGGVGLWHYRILQSLPILLYFTGVTLYFFALCFISLGLSLVYLLGLNATSLVEVMRGRLPLRRLLGVMFLGQFVAIVVVGITIGTLLNSYQDFVQLNNAKEEWSINRNYYQLSYSYSSAFTQGKEEEKQNKSWYDFANRTLKDDKGLFVKTNLRQFLVSNIANGVKITDYVPNGNTIYVSPNYLEKQNVGVSDEFLAQMKKLKRGEFGLIIPEKLKSSRKELESIYSEYMSGFSSRSLNPHSHHLFKVSVSTEFVKNKKKRFLYNTDSDIPMQFLNDPIIVVTTPEAMGDTPSSQLFWGTEVGSGLHMTGYKDSIDLLKQGGVYQWVSYLTNNRNSYYKILSESRSRLAFLLIGVLLGLLTSILLFDSMNLLYFEQFRKEIFIKRLSGMRFEEVHFNYLFSQICVLGVALVFLIFLTHHLIMSLLIVSLFIINMFTILYKQTLTESRTSVSVLKGK